MIKCLICDKEFQNRVALCNHLCRKHSLKKQEYYDKYIKTDKDGICKYSDCNNATKFLDIEHGYADCCCMEHTNLYRYGVKCNLNFKEVKEKAQKNSHTKEAMEKHKETNLKKYGVDHPMKSQICKNKAKQTSQERWGVDNPSKADIIKDKIKESKAKIYGDENYNNREQAKQTNLEKYGVDHPMKSKEIQEKTKQTNQERYGVDYIMQAQEFKDKSKATCQEHYNTDYWVQSIEYGKKKHNFSPIEQYFMDLLDKSNIKYTPEYKDFDRYPYFCDFYLSDFDIFIEIHSYWMHQKHFFNRDNQEDIDILRKLQECAKEKSIYKKAIYIWTISDLEKLECATKNQLNYVVLRNKDEINNWLANFLKTLQGDNING